MIKDLGLGILSWKGYESLSHQLQSFRAKNFTQFFAEKIIYFQEIDSQAKSIAKKYGFEAKGTKENKGIYGGFRGMAGAMESKYLMLVENDQTIDKNVNDIEQQLKAGVQYLSSGKANVVQYRNRKNAGEGKPSLARFQRFFPPENFSKAKKAMAFLRRTARPEKTKRLAGDAPFLMSEHFFNGRAPQNMFPQLKHDKKTNFLITKSRYKSWSNQPFMIRRDFFIEVILKKTEKTYTRSSLLQNGFKTVESEMADSRRLIGRRWWYKQNFNVAIAKGIFTHHRIGNRGH